MESLNLTKQSDDVVRDEIRNGARYCSGFRPKSQTEMASSLWRAGRAGPKIANHLGYRSIYWTIDSLDSVEPQKTPSFLINRLHEKRFGTRWCNYFDARRHS